MENDVQKELDALKAMLHNWRTGFVEWASEDGDNEYVLMEFTDEIHTHIYPFLRRLLQLNYLDESEAKEFMQYCYSQVEELRVQLSKVDNES
jgi:hypothetical protein